MKTPYPFTKQVRVDPEVHKSIKQRALDKDMNLDNCLNDLLRRALKLPLETPIKKLVAK